MFTCIALLFLTQAGHASVYLAHNTRRYCRCSEGDVAATQMGGPPYPRCPSPSTSRLASSPPATGQAASLATVRQALEQAVLQDNEPWWDEHQPDLNKMTEQCSRRRKDLAMQFFLRLHILVACQGSIPIKCGAHG